MGLDFVFRNADPLLYHEGEDGDDEAVEEEIGEETDGYGADYEEGVGTPLETGWRVLVVGVGG